MVIVHDLKDLRVDPRADGFTPSSAATHTARALIERTGVLFLNPGSAGPRRFKLPVAVAHLRVGKRGLRARIVEVGASNPQLGLVSL